MNTHSADQQKYADAIGARVRVGNAASMLRTGASRRCGSS